MENSFIDYFKSNTEINKGMVIIDEKLGGTTILDVTLDFEDNRSKSKKKKQQIFQKTLMILMEFEEESNEAKYWFTDYKMTKIEKLHDYLNSLEETGKVLSFATI